MQANSARRWLQQGEDDLAEQALSLLADTTLEAETDVRDYLLGAKTMMSAERPFFPSLREYLQRFSRQYALPVELTVPPELEAQGLPAAVEVQIFRIIQEALSNVRKHAEAGWRRSSSRSLGAICRSPSSTTAEALIRKLSKAPAAPTACGPWPTVPQASRAA